MKKSFLLLIAMIFSLLAFNSKIIKGEKEILADGISSLIKNKTEVIYAAVPTPEKVDTLSFKAVVQAIRTKEHPLLEATNFDSFIGEGDYDEVNVNALQLHKIYPEFKQEGYNYRAIANYKLHFSDEFYTLAVTVLKGEHEMETTLITYDLAGNIIAHILVSYSEIAEGRSKTESTIGKDEINIIYSYASEDGREEEEGEILKIQSNGTITEVTIADDLIAIVVKEFGLKASNLLSELQAVKMLPYKANEAIVVVAEIADGSEADGFIELNSHIAIVNKETKSISHKYFESFKTNGWVSDAIQLREITIDTAPYIIANGTRAFGVGVYYYGMSQANPYENKKLSLFIKSGDSLKKVLHNFNIMKYSGAWDTNCVGEFIGEKKVLIISKEKTNGYFNIIVSNEITETNNFLNENNNCDAIDAINTIKTTLKFDNQVYSKTE